MSPSSKNGFAALASLDEDMMRTQLEASTSGKSSSRKSKKSKSKGSQNEDTSLAEEQGSEATSKQQGKLKNALVWLDLEMTGLDLETDTIIEVACIMTDGDIERIIEGPSFAIHQTEEVLASMNPWCIEHHGKSGLTQRVRESTCSMEQAQEQLLAFVSQHTEQNCAQMAGNSIHVDRAFMVRHMPQFIEYLNYRIVDVSSVKELARRWYPNVYKKAPKKVMSHTALSDVKESIQELQYYRRTIFKDPRSL